MSDVLLLDSMLRLDTSARSLSSTFSNQLFKTQAKRNESLWYVLATYRSRPERSLILFALLGVLANTWVRWLTRALSLPDLRLTPSRKLDYAYPTTEPSSGETLNNGRFTRWMAKLFVQASQMVRNGR